MKAFRFRCSKIILLSVVFLATVLAGCRDEINDVEDPGNYFSGIHDLILLGEEAEGLSAPEFTLALKAEDGTVFMRSVRHERVSGVSRLQLDHGLAEGTYRLLYGRYDQHNEDDSFKEFGFGSRISITEDGVQVIDSFDREMHMAGSGTSSDPYVVSSAQHLFNMMMAVNDYDSNKFFTTKSCFRQECDIDMKQMSRSCDAQYGWMPIGADTNTPFRGTYLGQGYKVKNLIIDRSKSAGIGLFGFVNNASFDGVVMSGCSLNGQFAVGSIVGAVVTSGENNRGTVTLSDCRVENSKINCPESSANVGGLLGGTDMHSRAVLASCSSEETPVSGGMNVGGLTGGAGIYSSVMLSDCENRSDVISSYSGAGGMIGTADTLQIAGARNYGRISGGKNVGGDIPGIGTGGIAGGSGISWISGAMNHGSVEGYEGVGGIIGSTRVKGSASESYLYNQSVLRYCGNTADVKGSTFVGGAIGEAQGGAYAVYNEGNVQGDQYVGGICGSSSVAVVHNSINAGRINGGKYVGGVVGKCTWGSLAIDQNMAEVTASTGNAGGIVALAGNNTVVHYCSNFNTITGPSGAAVGGIAGEIGDPREWTGLNIAECVIGSAEIVMAFAGPVLAVAEEAFEIAEGVEVVIKIVETGTDMILQGCDYGLISYGIAEMVSPEVEEELQASMHSCIENVSNDIMKRMSELRRNGKGSIPTFTGADLSGAYVDNVETLADYTLDETNDEKFNERINEVREERAGKLEKVERAKEIFHTAVAGVAVVCSTVALVGGSIATGGTATAFLVMGSVAGIVGGVNAIVKTCTEFEANAVVISQCMNAGSIKGNNGEKVSSIAGRLEDGCLIEDCLNTAYIYNSSLEPFAGKCGSHTQIERCITLVDANYSAYGSPLAHSVICRPSLESGQTISLGNYNYLAGVSKMADKSIYTLAGIDCSETWVIPQGYSFPVPGKSRMRE